MNTYRLPEPPREPISHPHFGFTRSGQPLHRRTSDYLRRRHGADGQPKSAVAHFNDIAMLRITNAAFSPWTFYLFNLLAFVSLPAVLTLVAPRVFLPIFPHWLVSVSLISLVAWIAQTYFQLVLLPAIGVGQAVQGRAADARNEHMLDLVAATADAVNTKTAGGLTEVIGELRAVRNEVSAIRQRMNARGTS